ncbi:hypothetical protein [Aquimarina gracilis]|uniref:hypothetical protein n=1 Tax=Aquimarina gracilis TaxID=874422 RepID=UPI0031DAFDD0
MSYRILFGVLLALPIVLSGQEKKLYEGPSQIGTYKGEASYHYVIANNDTLLNGSFLLKSSNLEALLKKGDISFSIKGNFKDNTPSGFWKFQFNEFKTDKASTVEDNQYLVNVSGTQQIASGTFQNGRPDGQWVYVVQQIKNSQVDKFTFKSVVDFNNGVPQLSFTIEDEKEELVGMFLRNGIAHDKWTLYSDENIDEIESWNFNEGILESVEIRSGNGRIEKIKIFDNVPKANTKTITLDKKYLDVLKIKLQKKDSKKLVDGGIMRLLSQNDRYYKNIDSILSKKTSFTFLSKFNVKIPYFPLETIEKVRLDSISKNYESSRGISNSLLSNTQLTILRLSDENVRSLEESLEVISKKILDPLEELVSFYKEEKISFVSRKELLSKIWPDGVPDVHKIEKGVNGNSLISVKNLSHKTLYRLDSIQQILAKKITKQEREQEAIALEKKMIAQRNYLDQLSDSLRADTIPPVFFNTLQNIKKDTEDKLSKYSSINDVKAKLDYARELVQCFEKLDKVGETISKLPAQQYDIRSKYQDAVWNPFTATIMNETIKKRLIMAYEDVLIPYYLKRIEDGLPCEETEQWINLVEATYDRMLELRDEDTRKLERKLRKEDDPLVILERLSINSQIEKN